MKWIALILAFIAVLLIAGTALAQADDYELPWWSVGSGGGTASGGGYTLTGTAGLTDAVDVLTSGDFQLKGGFWNGVSVLYSILLPVIEKE